MGQFWLVLANSSHARFFRGASPTATLREVEELTNEAALQREQDLVTDREGRRHDDGHAQKSAMERDAMDREISDFARQIVRQLEQSRISGEIDALSIVADPRVLGKIRNEMSAPLQSLVLETVAKNVADEDVAAVQDRHLSVLA